MAGSLSIFFEEYDFVKAKRWLVETEPFLLKAVFVYVIAIWSIKFIQSSRRPFDLKLPLILWNAALAIFSILGVVYTTPTWIRVINKHGLSYLHTNVSEMYTDKTAGYWTFLWCVSKIPELVDTIFIVLRKKPLMFMHWYHHALTGYFAFNTFYSENVYMIWVVWLNYIIHSAMYSYYCLRAMQIKVPPQISQLITTSQIVQFLITHVAMAHTAYLAWVVGAKVSVTPYGFFVGAFMEVTYLMLWFRFYYISYYKTGGKKYVQHQEKVAKTQ